MNDLLYPCDHRQCSIRRLIVLFSLAAKESVEGLSDHDLLSVGMHSLHVLRVSLEEIADTTTDLVFSFGSLPTVSHIHDDPPVSTVDREDTEG